MGRQTHMEKSCEINWVFGYFMLCLKPGQIKQSFYSVHNEFASCRRLAQLTTQPRHIRTCKEVGLHKVSLGQSEHVVATIGQHSGHVNDWKLDVRVQPQVIVAQTGQETIKYYLQTIYVKCALIVGHEAEVDCMRWSPENLLPSTCVTYDTTSSHH